MNAAAQTETSPRVAGGAAPPSTLTLDLLEWVAERPRCYEDVMAAWRTGCPRFPIWEDALDDGLIRLEHTRGLPLGQTNVVLTAVGRDTLAVYRRPD